jgi:Cu-Zn family superoxide dismutase
MKRLFLLICAGLFSAAGFAGSEVSVTVHKLTANGLGDSIGVIVAKDSPEGLVLTPYLRGLTPGPHGFHVHENVGCGAGYNPDGTTTPGMAAGDHYDPEGSHTHHGPEGKGHRGDLPVLVANDQGEALTPVVAPRLSLDDIRGRTLVVHESGDNYADSPKKLGGGGARIACGSLELYKG